MALVSLDDLEWSNASWIDSSAHSSSNASVASLGQLISWFFFGERERRFSLPAIFMTTLHAPHMEPQRKRPGTAPESVYTNVNIGTVPVLPVPRLPPVGSLGTHKNLGTGATFIWDRLIYTWIIGSAVHKIFSTVQKICCTMPIFWRM